MLYYEATTGCGVGGLGSRCAGAPPRVSHPASWVVQRRSCTFYRSPSSLRHPYHAHWRHPYPLFRCPAPPFVILHIPYPHPFFRGPLLLGVSSYPPTLLTPHLALPSCPSFTPLVFPRGVLAKCALGIPVAGIRVPDAR